MFSKEDIPELTRTRAKPPKILRIFYNRSSVFTSNHVHARIQSGGQGVWTPLGNHKAIGFLSNTGLHPLENHKTTKPAFNVGALSVRQRNAI